MTRVSTPPRPTERSRRRTPWRLLALILLVVPLVGAVLTYMWFVNPAVADPASVGPADAVVLFAGREERLETALELMDRGVASALVIPNGQDSEIDDAEDLCEDAPFTVFCPPTDEDSTIGEARAIGRLAEEQGWSHLVGVTSAYHVHRATYLLDRCFEGAIEAVTPGQDFDREDVMEHAVDEWIAYLGSVILQPSC